MRGSKDRWSSLKVMEPSFSTKLRSKKKISPPWTPAAPVTVKAPVSPR